MKCPNKPSHRIGASKRCASADAGLTLLCYEFRSLCRFAAGEAGFTYTVTDARILKNAKPTTYAPTEYIAIPEEYRVFV